MCGGRPAKRRIAEAAQRLKEAGIGAVGIIRGRNADGAAGADTAAEDAQAEDAQVEGGEAQAGDPVTDESAASDFASAVGDGRDLPSNDE